MSDEPARYSRVVAVFLTWIRLQEHESAHPGQPYATVLDLRQTRPKAGIEELAGELSEMLQSPVSAEAFRKVLHRARCKYMELLTELGHGRR